MVDRPRFPSPRPTPTRPRTRRVPRPLRRPWCKDVSANARRPEAGGLVSPPPAARASAPQHLVRGPVSPETRPAPCPSGRRPDLALGRVFRTVQERRREPPGPLATRRVLVSPEGCVRAAAVSWVQANGCSPRGESGTGGRGGISFPGGPEPPCRVSASSDAISAARVCRGPSVLPPTRRTPAGARRLTPRPLPGGPRRPAPGGPPDVPLRPHLAEVRYQWSRGSGPVIRERWGHVAVLFSDSGSRTARRGKGRPEVHAQWPLRGAAGSLLPLRLLGTRMLRPKLRPLCLQVARRESKSQANNEKTRKQKTHKRPSFQEKRSLCWV